MGAAVPAVLVDFSSNSYIYEFTGTVAGQYALSVNHAGSLVWTLNPRPPTLNPQSSTTNPHL